MLCEYLCVRCIWLCVITNSRTRFRVNLHSVVTWMSRNARNRRDIGRLSDSNGIWTHNHLVCKKTFNCFAKLLRVHSLMVSTLHSAIKSSRSEPNSKLCAEVSSLWARPANALVPVKRAAYFFTWCPVNRGYSWKKTHIEKKKKKIYLTDKKHSRKAHLY